ncbi:hypothetical protein GH740_03145 [Microbacterium sp. SYP-A9085]|uniref:fibronectin type III domain-containing protein n=1 Tax=Microbacterium sp. SYP-A9085 TaxID=2664454 RepID=UPI00129AB4C4|nr:fibronectin type III domain-containing protein [Microbacterium sp. SYP-A9085]MRH28310.1 hypothetical protein [Microbacterium sp. SYP-A9085]
MALPFTATHTSSGTRRRRLAQLASGGAVCAVVLAAQPIAAFAAPPTVSTPDAPVAYVEQAAPVRVGEHVTFTGGTQYGGGYIDFGVAGGTAHETLSLVTATEPDTEAGAVTIVGDTVYLGDGSAADIIGSVDSTRSGGNGALRINFVSPFTNPSFEEGATITGWTMLQGRIDLGVTNIAGYIAQDQSTYAGLAGNGQYAAPADDDTPPQSGATYTIKLNKTTASDGAASLELTSAMTTAEGCDVVHGPAVYSDPFDASHNDKIYFDWRAFQSGDNFHVYGYILNTATGTQTPVLDATGGNEVNAFVTKETTIPANGSYRFVFVGGTQDFTCGKKAGATLLIDNVRVYGTKVNDAVVAHIAGKLQYANASDDPATSRTITVTVADSDGAVSAASSIPVSITPVDDAPVLASVAPITLTNTEGAQTYVTTTGTLDASDPDSPITTSIVGGTAATTTIGGITYTREKRGTYGTLYLDTVTGRYAFVPKDDAVDARQTADHETFEFEVSAPDLSPADGPAKTARRTLTVTLEVPATVPGQTANAVAQAGTLSAELSWTAPSWTAGAAITGYAIERSTDNGVSWTAVTADTGTADTTRAIAGLDAGDAVIFRVAAITGNGQGAWSAATTPVTPYTVPAAPATVAVAAGDRRATLTWSAPASDGGSPLTGYVLEQSGDGGKTWTATADVDPTHTDYVATGLTNGATVHFRVSARNAAGTGPAATPQTITPRTVADAPAPLTVTPGDGRVELNWPTPADDGGAPVTGYRIEISTDGGMSWSTVVADTGSTDTRHVATGLVNGTPVTFRVGALNAAGVSAAAAATATPRGPATAVTVTSVKVANRTLVAEFGAPADDGGSPISGYQYSLDEGATWIDTKTTTSPLVIEGLVNGTPYRLQLRAVTDAGPGEPSSTSRATPVLAPVTGPEGDRPSVSPGRSASTLSGFSEPVTTTSTLRGDWIVSGGGFTLRFQSRDANGTTLALSNGALVAPVGGSLRIQGSGYAPHSALDLWLLGPGVLLGQTTASADGTFELTLTLPDGIPLGVDSVQVNGLDPDGHVRSTVAGITVTAAVGPASGLAESGGTLVAAGAGSLAALLLLTAGAWVLAVSRRRTRVLSSGD